MFKRVLISLVTVLALAGAAQASHPVAFRSRFVAPRHRVAFVAPVHRVAFVAPVVHVQAVQFVAPVQVQAVQAFAAPAYSAPVVGCNAFFRAY